MRDKELEKEQENAPTAKVGEEGAEQVEAKEKSAKAKRKKSKKKRSAGQ